jgi:hypothetical protein
MLVSLLREVGSFNKVMDMLQKPGPFVLPPALTPVAAAFLFISAKEHGIKIESWQSWAAPLLMGVGATWASQAAPPTKPVDGPVQPTYQIQQQVDNKAEVAKTAANLVKRIVKLMQLKNFVEYKGK